MGKVVHLNFGKEEELVKTAHARSSPVRLRILELVNTDKLSIADIARRLQIPASSAALHIRELQEANLVRIEMQLGTRGSVKLCTRAMDKIDIRLTEMNGNVSDTLSVEMPIGAYTDCQGKETCGIADAYASSARMTRKRPFSPGAPQGTDALDLCGVRGGPVSQ